MTARCGPCGHVWTLRLALPMKLGVLSHTLKQKRCPRCNGSSETIYLGGQSATTQPDRAPTATTTPRTTGEQEP